MRHVSEWNTSEANLFPPEVLERIGYGETATHESLLGLHIMSVTAAVEALARALTQPEAVPA